MTELTLLEKLKQLVNDGSLQKDYQKAKEKKLKAAATRVRRVMHNIREIALEIRVAEMLEVLNKPDPRKAEKEKLKKRQDLEWRLEDIKSQLAALDKETSTK